MYDVVLFVLDMACETSDKLQLLKENMEMVRAHGERLRQGEDTLWVRNSIWFCVERGLQVDPYQGNALSAERTLMHTSPFIAPEIPRHVELDWHPEVDRTADIGSVDFQWGDWWQHTKELVIEFLTGTKVAVDGDELALLAGERWSGSESQRYWHR